MRPLSEHVIERLTFIPAQLRVIEEHYPKYACRACDKFVQAPIPKRALVQTRFDDQLIAGLVVSKLADFIPNYRQEQIFKRSGVQLHRSSKDFMDAGKKRLAGDSARAANTDEVKALCREPNSLLV